MEAKNPKSSAKRSYRRYDDHFKTEALRQLDRGVTVSDLATPLGVSPSLLHRWKKQAQAPAAVVAQAAEVKRLTQELKARQQEVDILKKA